MVANFQQAMLNFLKNIAGGPEQNITDGQQDVASPLLDASNENMVTPEQRPMQMKNHVTPTHFSTPKKQARRQLDMDLKHAF